MPKAFLDIDIGDPDTHSEETAKWDRACQYDPLSPCALSAQVFK
jgi:hypothetical protein